MAHFAKLSEDNLVLAVEVVADANTTNDSNIEDELVSESIEIDKNELEQTKLNYGQNIRSDKHIGMFGNKPFSAEDHKNYLKHEKIDNLVGLEIELVYEWELGSMLIFDRTNLHCSSSKIEGKKIGLTTFTKI